MNKSYGDKLKNPLWQKKRLEIFKRDNWTCQSCNRTDLTLHIHHLFYLPGCDPWDYRDSHLVTYCENCHNSEHLIGNQINESLIEIIKNNPLLIKPVAQLCILSEKFDGFGSRLKDFLNDAMVDYLETKKGGQNV